MVDHQQAILEGGLPYLDAVGEVEHAPELLPAIPDRYSLVAPSAGTTPSMFAEPALMYQASLETFRKRSV